MQELQLVNTCYTSCLRLQNCCSMIPVGKQSDSGMFGKV